MRARLGGLTAVLLLLASLPGELRGGPGHEALQGRQARRAAARCAVPLLRGAPDGGGAQAARALPRVSPHRSLAAGARAGRGRRGRARLSLDRLGRLLPVHARLAAPAPRPDRGGQPRHRQLRRDQLPAPAGGQGGLREARSAAARGGSAAAPTPTGPAPPRTISPPCSTSSACRVVDIYGDSYGTYFAQAFAVRHPERVRAVVLDAAFGVDGFDAWAREESVALRFAWPAGVRALDGLRWRRAGRRCGAGRVRLQDASARRAGAATPTAAATGSRSTAPRSGRSPATPPTTTRSTATSRPPCARYERGDRAPLLRIAAEDLPFTGGGPVKEYSEGAYAAVACHDYPTLWDPAAPFAARRDQLAAARAALDPAAFAPFPNDIWLRSLYVDQLVTGCLRWPAPRYPDPPVPPGAGYPTVPVLVLDGDLDVITPLGDSTRAARAVPQLDARDGAQHRPRHGAGGLQRLRVGDRAPLPRHARARRRELRRAHRRGACGARLPAHGGRGAPPAESAGAARPLDREGPPRRLERRLGGGRRARALVADVRVRRGTGCAGEASPPRASTSPTRRSACGCAACASSGTWR